MLTTIELYGDLGEQFGRSHKFDVDCPAEAIAALSANFSDFASTLMLGGDYQVLVGDDEIDISNVRDLSHGRTIAIIPVAEGSGSVGRIIAGVALLGLGLSGVGLFGIGASKVALLGGALALGGVSSLLTPTPKKQAGGDERKASFTFGGAVNTEAAGGSVPLVYGRHLIGSQVVSAGIVSYSIV